ncbi:MAG: hypothetical protein QOD31_2793 [Pseudonocardiales bacterium]|nr:hypothetical protein [Pseudonocardiales bacterium]
MTEPEIVEIRVHGVSGTPPEDLLDVPLVAQQAGDGKAGFYKPRLSAEQRDPRTIDGEPATTGPRLEGYAWGGLTSGAPSRALWLLLLPFTLLNVAPRLRPGGRSERTLRLLWFFSRLLALAMTVLIVAAVAGVSVDLFAYQCAPGVPAGPSCSSARPGWLMHPLLGMSNEHRAAVGALVPLAVLALLWQLSGRTINNYEGIPIKTAKVPRGASDGTRPATRDGGPDDVEPTLGSRWMWENEYQVRRLRHLHLLAGFLTILWIVAYPLSGAWDGWRKWGTAAVVLYIVVMLLWPAYTGRRQSAVVFVISWAVWGILVAYAAVLAHTLIWGHPLPNTGHGGLPGYAGTAKAIFSVLIGLYLIFSGLIIFMSFRWAKVRGHDDPRSLWDGSAIVLAALAIFLGAVFSSGVYVFAAAWLHTGSLKPGFGEVTTAAKDFQVPDVIRDATRAYAVSVAALAVLVVGIALAFVANRIGRLVHLRKSPTEEYQQMLRAAYRGGDVDWDSNDAKARAKQVAKTFWLARRVDVAHKFLALVIAVGVIITGFFTWLLIFGTDRGRSANPFINWHNSLNTLAAGSDRPKSCTAETSWTWARCGFLSARSLEGTGAYLAVLTIVLLVGLGAAAFRVARTRRSVGILWDLASFWPRSAHPFAAPCYAERAVPDLVTRVYWHARDEKDAPRRIVVAAHSQGTVISMATFFQLKAIDDAEAPSRPDGTAPVLSWVAFLSFGCVLRRLYAKFFPAYFGVPELEKLRDDVLSVRGRPPRWRNLWRYSDYLGGQVTAGPPPVHPSSDPIEVELVDPGWARPPGDTQLPRADMHSNYWRDPVFAEQVGVLAKTVPAVPTEAPTDESADPRVGAAADGPVDAAPKKA